MNQDCRLPAEDLVAYYDGELRGARLEYTEAHVRACPICREWLNGFEETGRLLREHTPLVDDPAGRAAVKARIEELASQPDHYSWLARRGWWIPRALTFVVPLAAVVLLLASLWPAPLEATGSRLAEFLTFAEQQVGRTVDDRAELPGQPITVPDASPAIVKPVELPLGLVLVDQEERENGGMNLYYRSPNVDLALRIGQAPVAQADTEFPTEDTRITQVEGVEVGWLDGPRAGTVSAMLWERRGVVFLVMIVEAPAHIDGGLELDDALSIAKALMEHQDEEMGG